MFSGWCPVDRILPPLKNFKAVLGETGETQLWIKNMIVFGDNDHDYNYILDNYLGNSYSKYSKYKECKYHPVEDPFCPIFELKDIIKYTPNAGESYEEMAKFGGIIMIKIEWNCWHNSWKIESLIFGDVKCKPLYSFKRLDNERGLQPLERSAYGENLYFNNMKTRVKFRSYKIRFIMRVLATMSQFDLLKLTISIGGCYGFYSFLNSIFEIIVTKIYDPLDEEKILGRLKKERLDENSSFSVESSKL